MIPFYLAAGIWLNAIRILGPFPPGESPFPANPGKAVPAISSSAPASLRELSDEELYRRVEKDPASLGSLAIGTPGNGLLINPVALPPGPRWEIMDPAASYGTSETVAFVQAAIDKVHELFLESPPLFLGDMSLAEGSRLKRHATHQAGRDVDFGFYYKGGKGVWYAGGTAANLDLPRNWARVRALLTCTDVETILLDTRIQRLLYNHALTISEDRAWLDRVFQFSRGAKEALIQHVAGHRTHYHVRFYNRDAQEIGRRAYPFFVQLKKIKPSVFTVTHVVRPGETLGHLAARYGTSVRAIQQANGLATNLIRAGRTYRIPLRGAAAPPAQPVVVRARRLPPRTPEALSAAAWPTPLGLYGDRLARIAGNPSCWGGVGRRF